MARNWCSKESRNKQNSTTNPPPTQPNQVSFLLQKLFGVKGSFRSTSTPPNTIIWDFQIIWRWQLKSVSEFGKIDVDVRLEGIDKCNSSFEVLNFWIKLRRWKRFVKSSLMCISWQQSSYLTTRRASQRVTKSEIFTQLELVLLLITSCIASLQYPNISAKDLCLDADCEKDSLNVSIPPFFLLLAARVRSSCEEGPGQSALQSA